MDALQVGMRLHALHADGEYYAAEVVALARGRAQVRFAGYDAVAWCAPSQLRSRALRGSRAAEVPAAGRPEAPRASAAQRGAEASRARRLATRSQIRAQRLAAAGEQDLPDDVECAICYQAVRGQGVALPCADYGCSSIFHWGCIAPWMERNPSCPLCRREVPVLEEQRASQILAQQQAEEQQAARRHAEEQRASQIRAQRLAEQERAAQQQAREQQRLRQIRAQQLAEEERLAAARRAEREREEREREEREQFFDDCDDDYDQHVVLECLREEFPGASDGELWDRYHDRLQEDAEEFGGYNSGGS